jgi:RNA polymerase subunit RPABC4/transcription elongation factor Spt4
VKRLFQSLLFLVAALHLIAGPLGVMQVVAWSKMIKDYSQEKGLLTGVMETFDGDHPCKMCKKISTSKQDEQKNPLIPQSKLDMTSKWFGMIPTMDLPSSNWRDAALATNFVAPVEGISQWGQAPPVPPPRLAA